MIDYDINILDKHSSYLGFTYNKPVSMKRKIKRILNKNFRYYDIPKEHQFVITSRKNFILFLTMNNYIPKFIEEKRYTKGNEFKKIITYTMELESKNEDFPYWIVTKIEYDFANYILNNKLNSLDEVYRFLKKEKSKIY